MGFETPDTVLFILQIAVVFGICGLAFNFILHSNVLCNHGTVAMERFCCDEMRDSSYCFNPVKRCSWECGNYGGNFSGNLSGCTCDCGDYLVSMCSGFRYVKEG